MEHRTVQLENGITLATAEMPHMESVCMGIWTPVGSRHETPELNGIAHFTEHLLFKGTKRRNARQISIDVESVGGSINAFTGEDQTCYHVAGPAATLPRLSDVLTDMFTHSTFPDDEIEREREVIEEEIAMYRDQPTDHIDDLISATMWPGSSLGRPITGTEESIARFRRDDFLNFTRNNYGSNHLVVAVAGKIRHDEVTTLIEKELASTPQSTNHLQFERWQSDGLNPSRRPLNLSPPMTVVEREIEQAHLTLAFHAIGRHDKRYPAMKLLNVLLGENMSSRLWQELREKRGLCYTVETDINGLEDTGLFEIHTGLDPSNIEEALELVQEQLEQLKTKGPSEIELDQARDFSIGQSLVSLEATSSQAMWLGESLISYGRVIEPEQTREDLRRVTASEIQELAAEIFTPANAGLAFIGPKGSERNLGGWAGSR